MFTNLAKIKAKSLNVDEKATSFKTCFNEHGPIYNGLEIADTEIYNKECSWGCGAFERALHKMEPYWKCSEENYIPFNTWPIFSKKPKQYAYFYHQRKVSLFILDNFSLHLSMTISNKNSIQFLQW